MNRWGQHRAEGPASRERFHRVELLLWRRLNMDISHRKPAVVHVIAGRRQTRRGQAIHRHIARRFTWAADGKMNPPYRRDYQGT